MTFTRVGVVCMIRAGGVHVTWVGSTQVGTYIEKKIKLREEEGWNWKGAQQKKLPKIKETYVGEQTEIGKCDIFPCIYFATYCQHACGDSRKTNHRSLSQRI